MSSKTNTLKDLKYTELCFLEKAYDFVVENGYPDWLAT
jgi:hypothetical protein